MFREALKTAIQMVFSLETTWKHIATTQTSLYRNFLLPLWALIVISSFIGKWLISRNGSLELGVKTAISEVFILFIGFFVTAFILNEYIKRLTDVIKNIKATRIFTAYSSSLIYLVDIIVSLANDLFFLWLFTLYTFYIVYVGAEIFYRIIPERRVSFMVIATVLILGIPLVVKYLLSLIIS